MEVPDESRGYLVVNQLDELLAWESLIARVEVGGTLPVTIRVYDDHRGGVRIAFSMWVAERDTGARVPIERNDEAPRGLYDDDERLSFLRWHLRELYCHELDEQLVLKDADGVRTRPFDPHPEEKVEWRFK